MESAIRIKMFDKTVVVDLSENMLTLSTIKSLFLLPADAVVGLWYEVNGMRKGCITRMIPEACFVLPDGWQAIEFFVETDKAPSRPVTPMNEGLCQPMEINVEQFPAEVDAIVTEAISLSGYIKVALVILCILLVLAIIRLCAFGLRCIFFKARDWIKANEYKPPPQVILLMPTGDRKYRRTSNMFTDQQTKNILEKIQQYSIELFNEYDTPKHVTGNKPWVTGKISSRSAKLSDV